MKHALTAMTVLGFGFLVLMVYFTLVIPNPFTAGRDQRAPIIQVLARDGALLAERGRPHDYIPLVLIPRHVQNAVTATEDQRFHEHWGLDLWGLSRALFANLRAGRFSQGGSTITQQLAKNLFLSHDRTLMRKANELALALWLELRLSKSQILELYLNQVYFGSGAYGIEAAAQTYFDKSARALTVSEAALLAGLLQAPSRYAPLRDPRRAITRSHSVLARMVRAGHLSEADAAAARAQRHTFSRGLKEPGRQAQVFGFAVDAVLERMPQVAAAQSGLLIVETTIDARLQRSAQTALSRILSAEDPAARTLEGAVVVLDGDGGIRALVGGRDYDRSQFNRATKARRQPGSAYKPVVYLAALQQGLHPETVVYDLPVTVGNWSPRNVDNRFAGAMTLEESLARSVNTVPVRLQQQVGIDQVIAISRRLGLRSDLRSDPTLALGTSEVGVLELANSYAVFATGGLSTTPHLIERIRTPQGRIVYARAPLESVRLFDYSIVAHLTRMLTAVVTTGSGRNAQLSAHPAAGKTGTTQDGRDTWFVGFTRQLTAAVWIGHEDGSGRGTQRGSGLPARLWRAIMQDAHRDLTPQPLLLDLTPGGANVGMNTAEALFEADPGDPSMIIEPQASTPPNRAVPRSVPVLPRRRPSVTVGHTVRGQSGARKAQPLQVDRDDRRVGTRVATTPPPEGAGAHSSGTVAQPRTDRIPEAFVSAAVKASIRETAGGQAHDDPIARHLAELERQGRLDYGRNMMGLGSRSITREDATQRAAP
ncbi:MAG: transglycosylase domain-containing protein [Hyphomicrobiaceae bacterium]